MRLTANFLGKRLDEFFGRTSSHEAAAAAIHQNRNTFAPHSIEESIRQC